MKHLPDRVIEIELDQEATRLLLSQDSESFELQQVAENFRNRLKPKVVELLRQNTVQPVTRLFCRVVSAVFKLFRA